MRAEYLAPTRNSTPRRQWNARSYRAIEPERLYHRQYIVPQSICSVPILGVARRTETTACDAVNMVGACQLGGEISSNICAVCPRAASSTIGRREEPPSSTSRSTPFSTVTNRTPVRRRVTPYCDGMRSGFGASCANVSDTKQARANSIMELAKVLNLVFRTEQKERCQLFGNVAPDPTPVQPFQLESLYSP